MSHAYRRGLFCGNLLWLMRRSDPPGFTRSVWTHCFSINKCRPVKQDGLGQHQLMILNDNQQWPVNIIVGPQVNFLGSCFHASTISGRGSGLSGLRSWRQMRLIPCSALFFTYFDDTSPFQIVAGLLPSDWFIVSQCKTMLIGPGYPI